MRSITAVIASALASCASRAVLARLSAPTVTQARSGARFTTASPLVTITAGGGPGGWGCGCAATGSAAVIRNTTASVSFIPYLSAYSAYRGRMPRPLQRTCDTESDRIGIGVGRHLVAMAARQHPHVGDEPAAAADEAQVADGRSRRISRAGAGSLLPLGLGRQPEGLARRGRQPRTVGERVVVAHERNGVVGPVEGGVAVLPDVRRADLPERTLALGPPGLHDQGQLVDGGRAVAGLAGEPRVVGVGHRLDAQEEVVDVNPVQRALILFGVLGPHEE